MLPGSAQHESLSPGDSKYHIYPQFYWLTLPKRWNGRFFEPDTLQSVGVVVQVGHIHPSSCKAPVPGPPGCLVLHVNGFHPISLRYCGCRDSAGDNLEQVLRSELYPATLSAPTTFCTFRVLEHFHTLTLQSKINAYDFYMSLKVLTDSMGLRKQYVRSQPFYRSHLTHINRTASNPGCVLFGNGVISRC